MIDKPEPFFTLERDPLTIVDTPPGRQIDCTITWVRLVAKFGREARVNDTLLGDATTDCWFAVGVAQIITQSQWSMLMNAAQPAAKRKHVKDVERLARIVTDGTDFYLSRNDSSKGLVFTAELKNYVLSEIKHYVEGL